MLLYFKKTKALPILFLLAFGAVLTSFSKGKGGEGFEIYLNSRLVLQQYGNQMKEVKSLQLDEHAANSELTVKYYHCGKVGKDRVITIRDEKDNVLKQWKFVDAAEQLAPMSCKVKDILSLKKGQVSTLKLYYSSSEIPTGRLLTSLVVGESKYARL